VPVLPGTRTDVVWEAGFGPLRCQDGTITGVLVLLRDVTSQHQMSQRARESEERFRSTVDGLLDAFGVLSAVRDESGQIVDLRAEYVNAVTRALFQRPPEELVGQRLLEVLPSMVPLGTFAKLVHTIETGEPCEYQLPWFEEDALAGAFEVRGAKLGDGIVITMRDVTSRVKAEQHLRASEERYRVTLASAASGFANVGLDGRFMRVNRRFCEITGYSEEELLARTYRDITHPDDMDLHVAKAQQLVSGEISLAGGQRSRPCFAQRDDLVDGEGPGLVLAGQSRQGGAQVSQPVLACSARPADLATAQVLPPSPGGASLVMTGERGPPRGQQPVGCAERGDPGEAVRGRPGIPGLRGSQQRGEIALDSPLSLVLGNRGDERATWRQHPGRFGDGGRRAGFIQQVEQPDHGDHVHRGAGQWQAGCRAQRDPARQPGRRQGSHSGGPVDPEHPAARSCQAGGDNAGAAADIGQAEFPGREKGADRLGGSLRARVTSPGGVIMLCFPVVVGHGRTLRIPPRRPVRTRE
jgi:PAS domain-containing protein